MSASVPVFAGVLVVAFFSVSNLHRLSFTGLAAALDVKQSATSTRVQLPPRREF